MMPIRDPSLGEDTRGTVDVSVVVPCYRAAELATRSVTVLTAALDRCDLDWEIIVVDDGGGDFLPSEWQQLDRVRLVQLPVNRGKGAAVREGMLLARGNIRIFTDVDLPFGSDFVPVMVSYLRSGFHLVLGDRNLPGSSYHGATGWPRRIASAAFTAVVGTIVTGGFFDTQCGLKAIRGDVADALFPILRLDRFAFDVELVYVALKHGLDIKRIPVHLLHNETSSVRLLRDSARGAMDILSIKASQLRGLYRSPALDSIVRHDFEAVRVRAATANATAAP
jgi:dolichyl-phosphate beta-glucosyltransferase